MSETSFGAGFISFHDANEDNGSDYGEDDNAHVLPTWFRESSWHSGSPYETLHNEIMDFCDIILPTSQEISYVQETLEYAKSIVNQTLGPKPSVHVFGSNLTKLLLPTSDLDVTVTDAPANAMGTMSVKIHSESRKGTVHNVEIIQHAKVPIIKFVYGAGNISCDVCFNQNNSVEAGDNMMKLLNRYPCARPLILVIKYFVAQRNFNDTYNGGLGSFLIQLMVIRSIQEQWARDDADGCPRQSNLGVLLVHFFRMFGHNFNYSRVGFSVRGSGFFFKKEQYNWFDPNRPHLLCVENPWDPYSDVGQNSYNIRFIVEMFKSNLKYLERALLKPPASNAPESILSAIIRLDDTLKKRSLPDVRIFSLQMECHDADSKESDQFDTSTEYSGQHFDERESSKRKQKRRHNH